MRYGIAMGVVALVFCLSAGCIVVQPVPVAAEPAPADALAAPGDDAAIFYDTLAPYGQWVSVEPYGLCWVPDGVDVDWRPYTYGRWDYTDFGWTWISGYPWGWACFHYGRWFWAPEWGWCWVPGRVWAPAWCAWRSDAGWFGWCALPPSPTFRGGLEFEIGDLDWDDAGFWRGWCFCERRFFCDVDLRSRIVFAARNVTILRVTRHVPGIRLDRGRAVNRCFAREEVEHAVGRRVPVLAISDVKDHGDRRPRVEGQRLFMFRPHISSAGPPRVPPTPSARPGMGSPELLRKQARERDGIERRLYNERSELDRLHNSGLQPPPEGDRLDRVLREHREERRAFDEQERSARELLEERHQREWRRSEGPGGRGGDTGRGSEGPRGRESDRSGGNGGPRGGSGASGDERGPDPGRGDRQQGPQSGPAGGTSRDSARGGDSGRVGPPQRGEGSRAPEAGRADAERGGARGTDGGRGGDSSRPGGERRDSEDAGDGSSGRRSDGGRGSDSSQSDDGGRR